MNRRKHKQGGSGTLSACCKAEGPAVTGAAGQKNKTVSKPALEQIRQEYSGSEVVMGEMLASIPADGLSIEEAFNLYVRAMNWAEGDRFYREVPGESPEEV